MENTLIKDPSKVKVDNYKSISQALTVLNEAAKDSGDEIQRMINKDFALVKNIFGAIKPGIKENLMNARDSAVHSVHEIQDEALTRAKNTANYVDTNVRQYPWQFMGGAAAIAVVLGFMFGRKSK